MKRPSLYTVVGIVIAVAVLFSGWFFLSGSAKTTPFERTEKYRKAADKGDAKSQFNLGDCYDRGNGVKKDAGESAKWFRMAADQGFTEAQYRLGSCYSQGEGVPKDDSEAAKLYRMAAEKGHTEAEYCNASIRSREIGGA